MTRVSLLKCEQYDLDTVKNNILKNLELLKINPGISKNKSVAVKPNLLASSHPDRCIITHKDCLNSW